MNLDGKTIVVTGAARGLGTTMAKTLTAKGARLALVDVDGKALRRVAAECAEQGADAEHYTVNVANETEVSKLFEALATRFGRVDALINNAGILRDSLLVKYKDGKITDALSLRDWQAVIDVNLTGVFLCGREAAARMVTQQQGGVIINISSISRHGNVGQTNYSAAKAGVEAMTVVWAKELARYGIRVAAIAPGFVNTEMVAGMPVTIRDKMTAGIPLQRLAQPEEIAHTVVYILENDYVSGRCMEVDGGLRL